MNLDSDPVALGADEYTYMKNGVPLMGVDGHDWAVGHVFGNTEVVNSDLPSGTNTVIGRCEDLPNNRIFFAIHNNTASNHTIYVLNSDLTFQRVIRTSLLGFQLGVFVDMDISDNILIITDNTAEIKKINVTKAIAGSTYTPTAEELTLVKRPPQRILTASTVSDGTFDNNHILDKYFQFYYQYVYEDDDESVWSHFSTLVRASRAIETGYDHNAIDVTISGSEVIPATVKRINYAVRINGSNEVILYRSDFPVGGVLSSLTHRFYNDTFLETISDDDSFLWFYSVPRKAKSIRLFKNRLFTLGNTEGYEYTAAPIENFTVTAGTSAGFGKSHKNRGSFVWGLMFFDNYGRHAGVHIGADDASKLTFGDRVSDSVLLRNTATFDISSVAQADIPLWATHYAIVRTQCQNISFFLQHRTADIFGYNENGNDFSLGAPFKYEKGFAVGSGAGLYTKLAIDISSLTRDNIGYTWQNGDRIRIYDVDFDFIFDGYILSQSGRFIICEWNQTMDISNATVSTNYNFEIYRPKTEANNIFYEIGQKYVISNPGTGSRAFATTSAAMDGDVEVWNRSTVRYKTSGYSSADPFTNELENLSITNYEMMNAHDKFFNIWVGNSPGRSQIFSNIGSKEIYRENSVRFSQQFNRGSLVSRLNIFYELDEYTQIPSRNGPGIKLQDADNVLVAICQNETTAIYVGEAFINLATGSEFLAKTDSVIGDDRKYLGGFGTLHPESVCEYSGRVYYYDMTKGVIVRRSNDGLTAISDVFGIGSYIRKFSRDNFANRATMKFHGGYDPVHHIYLLTAVSSGGSILWTIGFHEPSNGWIGFFDYAPQMYAKINGFLISFNTGKTWLHNNSSAYMNFYGVQYQREMEFSVAVRPARSVEWVGVILDADDFHTDSGSNDNVIEITNDGAGFINGGVGGQYTTIVNSELVRKSGMLRSSIKRDINTPQNYSPSIRAKFEGNPMTGSFIRVKVHANKTNTTSRMRSFAVLYNITQGDLKSVINA